VYEGAKRDAARQLRRGECPADVLLEARARGESAPTFCFQTVARWHAAASGERAQQAPSAARAAGSGSFGAPALAHARHASTVVVDDDGADAALDEEARAAAAKSGEVRAAERATLDPFFRTLERAAVERPELLRGIGAVVAFQVGSAGAGGGDAPPHVWRVDPSGDPSGAGSVAYAESAAGAACTLRLKTLGDFIALYEGKLKPVQALWKGQLKIVGDTKVLKRLWPLMKHAGTMADEGEEESLVERLALESESRGRVRTTSGAPGSGGVPAATAIEIEQLQEELDAQVRPFLISFVAHSSFFCLLVYSLLTLFFLFTLFFIYNDTLSSVLHVRCVRVRALLLVRDQPFA
jgi:hypothetical protein